MPPRITMRAADAGTRRSIWEHDPLIASQYCGSDATVGVGP